MRPDTEAACRQVGGFCFYGAFVLNQVVHVHWMAPWWWGRTLLLGGFALVYLMRQKPRDTARGVWAYTLPYVGLLLPVALTLLPVPATITPAAVWFVLAVGLGICAAGLAGLWTSFGVGIEQRDFVDQGLYARIRHPIYLGECLMTAAAAWMHHSGAATVLAVAFICIQVQRARLEEQCWMRWEEGYGAYCQRTGMFLPRWRTRP